MQIKTKHFGEVQLDGNKIIHFENGILGFEEYKDFTLLYDNEEGESSKISWIQSIQEPSLAIPVISPFILNEDYNPELDDELLSPLGGFNEENILVMVSITVTKEADCITANLKAPFVFNTETKKAAQLIAHNPEYEIKSKISMKADDNEKKKGVE